MKTLFVSSLRHWVWAAAALILGVLALAVAIWIAWFEAIPITRLLRDPNAVAGQLWYVGLIEVAGIMTHAATTGILLFAAGLTRSSSSRLFLAGAGLLTGVMVLDDSYMLHEQRWFIGIPEHAAFAIYGLVLAVLLFMERLRLARTPILILILSLGFLGLAAVVDWEGGPGQLLPRGTEDMAEFVAFLLWAAYFISTARLIVVDELARS